MSKENEQKEIWLRVQKRKVVERDLAKSTKEKRSRKRFG